MNGGGDNGQGDFGFLLRKSAIGVNEEEDDRNQGKDSKGHFPLLFSKDDHNKDDQESKKRGKSKVKRSRKQSKSNQGSEEDESDNDALSINARQKQDDEHSEDLSENAE